MLMAMMEVTKSLAAQGGRGAEQAIRLEIATKTEGHGASKKRAIRCSLIAFREEPSGNWCRPSVYLRQGRTVSARRVTSVWLLFAPKLGRVKGIVGMVEREFPFWEGKIHHREHREHRERRIEVPNQHMEKPHICQKKGICGPPVGLFVICASASPARWPSAEGNEINSVRTPGYVRYAHFTRG